MKKFFIGFLILAAIAIPVGLFNESQTKTLSKTTENIKSVLDASEFWVNKNTTISESGLIQKIGEPDSIEEWTHTYFGYNYQIRTLVYGNYEYHFNNDMLQRISINETISYKNKNEILSMFGLKLYNNSEVKDNNFSYRVYNCGVHDFWVQYDSESKTISYIKITFGNLFGD